MLSGGKTQQQAADEIGWGLSKIKQYARLDVLCPNVWGIIVTELTKNVTVTEKSCVTEKVTHVTEGLLRNVLDLTEHHQLEIVNDLVSGKLKSGRVKARAEICRDREKFAATILSNNSNDQIINCQERRHEALAEQIMDHSSAYCQLRASSFQAQASLLQLCLIH